MKIFVTGCTGYIGSHTVVSLLENNYEVIGLDNFSNSKPNVLEKIKTITNKEITFYEGDMLDKTLLNKIFTEHKIECVIDFAAYKSVGDSVDNPIEYYINNVTSVLTLIEVMKENNVKSLIFSSSATVYGTPKVLPITEESEIGGTTNPYGTSKLFVEKILEDLHTADNDFNICILRYFNPVGAHKSKLLGENPNGIPANLMPYISKVANKELECLSVYGDDYDTKDGTGVRDYIHVLDLAEAHVLSTNKLLKDKGYHIYNIGTGTGYSVLEIIKAYEKVNNTTINYKIAPRRSGDIAACFANAEKAEKEINFKSKYTIEDMCYDSHEFIKNEANNENN